jgi:hypothetical protein
MGIKVQSGVLAGVGVLATILAGILIQAHIVFAHEPTPHAGQQFIAAVALLLFSVGFSATALLRGFSRRMIGLAAMAAGAGVYLIVVAWRLPVAWIGVMAGVAVLGAVTFLGLALARRLGTAGPGGGSAGKRGGAGS